MAPTPSLQPSYTLSAKTPTNDFFSICVTGKYMPILVSKYEVPYIHFKYALNP